MKRSTGLKTNPAKHREWQERTALRAIEKRAAKGAPDKPVRARKREHDGKPRPMKRRNPRRASALYERNFGKDGRRGSAVRAMGCFLRGHALHTCRGDVQAMHARARGRGAVKGDSGELLGACQAAHDEAGEYRTGQRAEFVAKYERDPVEIAAQIKVELDERFGPEPCWRCGQTEGHTLVCSTAEGRDAARNRAA